MLRNSEKQRRNSGQVLVLLQLHFDGRNLTDELFQFGFVVVRVQSCQALNYVLFVFLADVLTVGGDHEVFTAN